MKLKHKAQISPGVWRSSMVQLLCAIVLLIIGVPLAQLSTQPQRIEASLFSLVYIMALLAIGGRRTIRVRGVLLLALALITKWANEVSPGLIPPIVTMILSLLLLAFVITNLIRFILQAPKVNSDVLCAGVSAYLMLGVLWAGTYMVLSEIQPNSFILPSTIGVESRLDSQSAFYFSFITMTTVGYGDIIPRLPLARTLAFLESIVGTFYVAIMIARLVAQYSAEKTLMSNDNQ